jgi:hypothetical protein
MPLGKGAVRARARCGRELTRWAGAMGRPMGKMGAEGEREGEMVAVEVVERSRHMTDGGRAKGVSGSSGQSGDGHGEGS